MFSATELALECSTEIWFSGWSSLLSSWNPQLEVTHVVFCLGLQCLVLVRSWSFVVFKFCCFLREELSSRRACVCKCTPRAWLSFAEIVFCKTGWEYLLLYAERHQDKKVITRARTLLFCPACPCVWPACVHQLRGSQGNLLLCRDVFQC